MEMTRTELLPGVWLNCLRPEEGRAACLSVNLLTQLNRETAAMNALLPYVLRRGCTRYGDEAALSQRLGELGGVSIEPAVRRFGEIQCVGLRALIPEESEGTLRSVCELLGELLLHPATRGGLLLPRSVDSEREAMLERLRRQREDPRALALARCEETMCCFEDYAVGPFGGADEVENVRYQKLSKHYRALLPLSPIEIVFCGRADKKRLAPALREALVTLPRGEIDCDIGTELRMNALEEQPRELTEAGGGDESRLVLGFRLGDCMEDPDLAALTVFRALLGDGAEMDTHKGLLFLSAEVGDGGREAAQAALTDRIEALRRGEIGAEALKAAREQAAAALLAEEKSPAPLEDFSLSQIVRGLDCGPAELAELCLEVTAEELAAVAQSLDCDLIYLLDGGADGEEEDEAP